VNDEEQPEVVEEAAPPAPPVAEEFPFGTLPPQVSFATRQVQPPAECYISPDDWLYIWAWNAQAGVTLNVDARVLHPDGEIKQNSWTFIPTNDCVVSAWRQGLTEGFLLTLTVTSGQTQAGGCYVQVLLMRGMAPVHWPIAQVMVSGYLVRASPLGWPYPRYVGPCEGPGRPRVILGTNPPAGVQILEQVPAGVRWRLLSIFASLTTSAAVADRYVMLVLADPVTMWWVCSPLAAQPASVQRNYTWAVGVDARIGVLPEWIQDRLPDRITLGAGWGFYTMMVNMQAGDNWAAPQYYVEEWVEP
jgi:hypothetical protein